MFVVTYLHLVRFHVEDMALATNSNPQPLADHAHVLDGGLGDGKGLVVVQVPTTTWSGMEMCGVVWNGNRTE